jgi:hypothetical protein
MSAAPEIFDKSQPRVGLRRFGDDFRSRSSATTVGLEHLEQLAHWLDDGFRLPAVGIRFGWDAIAKTIPVFGDALAALVSLYIFQSLRRLNLPRVTRARMLTNIAIDYFVGLIPIIGTVFDVYWKPNVWNVALAERHLSAGDHIESRKARHRDWLFMILATLVAMALLAGTLALGYWVLLQLDHLLAGMRS